MYYLPPPNSVFNDTRKKHEPIEDGKYNVKLYKRSNSFYSNINDDTNPIILNLFSITSKVINITDFNDIKPNTNELYAYNYGGYINFSYTHSMIHGLSIDNITIDKVKFFNDIYMKNQWSKGVRFTFTESDISSILSGIDDDKLTKILDKCILDKSYYLDYNDEYGGFSVNSLKLNPNVVNSIFDVFKERFKSMYIG